MKRTLVAILAVDFVVWLSGTLILRLAGHLFLPHRSLAAWSTLYVVSALVTAAVSRAVYRWARIAPGQRLSAAAVFILPTLVFDAFTTLCFAAVFPHLDPSLSGAFGGWMLICSAGAVAGAWATDRVVTSTGVPAARS